ncbi:MAG: hypothetical protein ABWK05_04345 [Pyrobaculum sp.]
MKAELGRLGECIAAHQLKKLGYNVWQPRDFIRIVELTALYYAIKGECIDEPKTPLTFSIATPVGHVSVTYWQGRCLDVESRPASLIETSIYAPCIKKCIETNLGNLLELLKPHWRDLLLHRAGLATIDLYAEKDGVLYAVEVKTNEGKLSKAQLEKTLVFRNFKHLIVRVYLQTPLVEIKTL